MPDDIYIPAKSGERIPMHGGQPDWPADGRSVDFTIPYEARLVEEGTLVKKKASAKASRNAGDK